MRASSAPHARSKIDWRKEPEIVPQYTKQFARIVQMNKEKRFLKHNEKVRKQIVEEEIRHRRGEFARRVIYSPAIVAELQREAEMKLRMQTDKRYIMEKSDEEYAQLMNGIKQRVLARPLLVEQAPYFDRATNTGQDEDEMDENQDLVEGEYYEVAGPANLTGSQGMVPIPEEDNFRSDSQGGLIDIDDGIPN